MSAKLKSRGVAKKNSRGSVRPKKSSVSKSLEQTYSSFFTPDQLTPQNFKIFTLTDWDIPVSTGDHT